MNIVLIDDSETSRSALGAALVARGHCVWVQSTFALESIRAIAGPLDLILSEQRVSGEHVFKAYSALRSCAPTGLIAIVTAYPSVAAAVRAVRLGFDAYLAKPANADTVLSALPQEKGEEVFGPADEPDAGEWPSLDRTIWEYLNQVYATAGSMSEAARRLRLDRRSLRRMLAKYPPAR
jgi:two-component system response regulator RegA